MGCRYVSLQVPALGAGGRGGGDITPRVVQDRVHNVLKKGYAKPFSIQRQVRRVSRADIAWGACAFQLVMAVHAAACLQTIPPIMSGRDVIGIAKTGSGKTLAYLIPMFRQVRGPRALDAQVLCVCVCVCVCVCARARQRLTLFVVWGADHGSATAARW